MAPFGVRLVAATLLVTLLLFGKAAAQEVSPAKTACQQAWLAPDWETVAKECANIAAEDDTTAAWHVQEFGAAGTTSLLNSQQLTNVVGPDYLAAGEVWTRVAVADGHLNREEAYRSARANALSDLSEARHFGSPETVRTATAIADLIASENFLTDAPSSPLLTQLQ